MRDLLLVLVFAWLVWKAFKDPTYGVLGWIWMGVMNPHRLAYGFAHDQPWSMLIALVLFTSLLVNRDKLGKFPVNGATVALLIWTVWIGVSPWFSFYPGHEFALWSRAFKILLMVLVAMIVVQRKEQLDLVLWVLVGSIAFYGVKGGIFTLVTGGSARVFGPQGSFIEENNALALATIMTVPLIRYLQLHAPNKWVRRGCLVAMLLCMASALGSQSRGALLAILSMSTFLWLKGRNKLGFALVLALVLPLLIIFMPDSWSDRMSTIKTYDADASAMGRINAWHTAWNLALDRFPIGGGFAVAGRLVFERYAPDPTMVLTAHSIYFQALGEHGFIGLILFLSMFGLTWQRASAVIKRCKPVPELRWAADLAAMSQVSLVGYATGGAFLSLVYFDLPYYILLIVVVTDLVVARHPALLAYEAERKARRQALMAGGGV